MAIKDSIIYVYNYTSTAFHISDKITDFGQYPRIFLAVSISKQNALILPYWYPIFSVINGNDTIII